MVAADSQETFLTAGQPTRKATQKLFQLRSVPIVWGVSGDVGLSQKISAELQKVSTGLLARPVDWIRPALVKAVVPALREAIQNYIQLPGNLALPPPTADVLISGFTAGQPWILHIARNGADEQHEHRGFCAVGSGEVFAYFAQESVTGFGRCANLFQAQMIAYRVVDAAISVAAHGFGLPVQMWTIERDSARQLPREELDAIASTVGAWQEASTEIFRGFPLSDPQLPTSESVAR